MAKNKVSISFSKKNLDMYEILKNKDNSSSYICTLIRKDMNEHYTDIDFETKIKDILDKLLKDKPIIYDTSDEFHESSCNSLTNKELDLILNLF